MDDLIDRQATIDAIEHHKIAVLGDRDWDDGMAYGYATAHRHLVDVIMKLPSAEPEPVIPLQWIEAQIEWLKSLDNAFSTLTAGQISAMVNKWKDEQNE